ncbi:Lrp/AsnC family transcriptional regulator [Secundilactobacillus oryzae]|nr:Lrp/AsnC family transcriptional regulator [Secundilactobacillus oryzae]
MDKTDIIIISELQKNARVSLKELAEKCFITSPAIAARINRLETNGIIKSYQAVVDLPKLNYNVKAFIRLQLDPTLEPQFYQFVRESKHVLQCDCVTGDYSQLIQVAFENTGALDQFVNQVSQFGKTSTQIVFTTSIDNRGPQLSQGE